jgi:hypothetical protein
VAEVVIEAGLLACVAVVLFLAACYGLSEAERILMDWRAARRVVEQTEAEDSKRPGWPIPPGTDSRD